MKNKLLNSFLSGVITSTFVFTPTVFAQSEQTVASKKTKELFSSISSDGTKTYGDVWKKINNQFPKDETYQRAYNLFSVFANDKIPKTQIQEFDYKGRKALKTILDFEGESIVVEYLLSDKEMLKINGVTLSSSELNDDKALLKKIGHFKFVKKAYKKMQKSIFAQGYTPSYETWKKMSSIQKAEYIMRYRELLMAAQKLFKQPTANQVAKRIPANVELYASYFNGENSFAEIALDNPPPRTNSEAVNASEFVSDQLLREKFLGTGETDAELARTGPSCIIAGIAGEWKSNGTRCVLSKESKIWKTEETALCQQRLGKRTVIACQPSLYIREDGDPVCADTSSPDFQKATHPNGVCDRESKLDTAQDKYKFLQGWMNKIKKTGAAIDPKMVSLGEDGKIRTSDKATFDKITNNLIKPLSDYIDSAMKVCLNSDNSAISEDDLKRDDAQFKYNHELKKTKTSKKSKKRKNQGVVDAADPAQQNDACDGILKRAIKIRTLLTPQENGIVQSEVCPGWGPSDTFWSDSGNCKCKHGYAEDKKTAKLCVNTLVQTQVTGTASGVAEVAGTVAPAGIQTTEASIDAVSETKESCGFLTNSNPKTGTCDFAWGKFFMGGLGILAASCLAEQTTHIKVFGMCYRRRNLGAPLVYQTPIPGPLPTITTPTTTVPTTTAPRNSESTDVITVPSGAAGSVR